MTFVNEAYCRYFGMAREALIGTRYEPVIFEADREKVAQLINSLNGKNPMVMIQNQVILNL